ncbi:SsrA-binding protein SmpB [bacterium]|nr:SsrA-binding protein SmpB [bacterium]
MSLIRNKKAHLDYSFQEELEAGIELHGYEVKSLRAGRGKLEGAHIVARGGEAYLVGASIPAWQLANAPKEYDPERPRRLLLKTKEIRLISSAEGSQGLTIVPISVYNKGRVLKLSIAIARGKKKGDKRADLRAKDEKRAMDRARKQQ